MPTTRSQNSNPRNKRQLEREFKKDINELKRLKIEGDQDANFDIAFNVAMNAVVQQQQQQVPPPSPALSDVSTVLLGSRSSTPDVNPSPSPASSFYQDDMQDAPFTNIEHDSGDESFEEADSPVPDVRRPIPHHTTHVSAAIACATVRETHNGIRRTTTTAFNPAVQRNETTVTFESDDEAGPAPISPPVQGNTVDLNFISDSDEEAAPASPLPHAANVDIQSSVLFAQTLPTLHTGVKEALMQRAAEKDADRMLHDKKPHNIFDSIKDVPESIIIILHIHPTITPGLIPEEAKPIRDAISRNHAFSTLSSAFNIGKLERNLRSLIDMPLLFDVLHQATPFKANTIRVKTANNIELYIDGEPTRTFIDIC